jgi:hypothetical protein
MARECIQNCWRIQQILETMDDDNLLGAVGPIHPDMFGGDDTQAQRLLVTCEASYDCPGPGITEPDVVKGIIRKRTVQETVPTCGLPDEYFER